MHSASPAASARMTPTCSIVIRTLNEARYLDEVLGSVACQTYPAPCREVVVVDSGSTDRTLEIARAHGCRIVPIAREQFSFGRSLNLGCDAARGDFLVFISGHCVPTDADWLWQLVLPFRDDSVAITYGRQLGGPETKFSEHCLFEKYFPASAADAHQAPFFCNNANAAFRRADWASLRFDETLTGLEDMHLARALWEKGRKVAYAPRAAVYHYHHEKWRQVLRRYEREAIALRRILPEVHVHWHDALRYFLAGVLGDASRALSQRELLRRAGGIVAFRFCQYFGAWRGNHEHRSLFPPRKGKVFLPELDRPPFRSSRFSLTPARLLLPAMTSLRNIALLPMKAHSARVSGKNFRPFAGKPLFRWILDSLLALPEIDLVVINTDARDILAQNGLVDTDRVRIRDRRPELCGDFVSMNLVLADDLAAIEAETYLMTHTTNPLLGPATIHGALAAFAEARAAGRADSLFTVNRFQTRFYRADGSAVNHDPKKLIRTQDLEPWFEENSNLYLFDRASFARTQARIGATPMMFETPRIESADIDDQEGWDIAETLASRSARALPFRQS